MRGGESSSSLIYQIRQEIEEFCHGSPPMKLWFQCFSCLSMVVQPEEVNEDTVDGEVVWICEECAGIGTPIDRRMPQQTRGYAHLHHQKVSAGSRPETRGRERGGGDPELDQSVTISPRRSRRKTDSIKTGEESELNDEGKRVAAAALGMTPKVKPSPTRKRPNGPMHEDNKMSRITEEARSPGRSPEIDGNRLLGEVPGEACPSTENKSMASEPAASDALSPPPRMVSLAVASKKLEDCRVQYERQIAELTKQKDDELKSMRQRLKADDDVTTAESSGPSGRMVPHAVAVQKMKDYKEQHQKEIAKITRDKEAEIESIKSQRRIEAQEQAKRNQEIVKGLEDALKNEQLSCRKAKGRIEHNEKKILIMQQQADQATKKLTNDLSHALEAAEKARHSVDEEKHAMQRLRDEEIAAAKEKQRLSKEMRAISSKTDSEKILREQLEEQRREVNELNDQILNLKQRASVKEDERVKYKRVAEEL